ncbi:MAG: TIGR03617 family F420-dependent LLM class oxidoreductase [Anaerolineae bacterium]|jgi:probable F420-dependent oxidoreductase|nr:TIGR03617 family F420-dependent LLM class oxidoreductase [Anaerolineae bacterium]
MKFDVTIFPDDLNSTRDLARIVEDYGFDGLWTAEAAHNPFLPLTLAASSTQRIHLGTAIAVAFPRSPMVTAQIAWDLAAQSRGRFILGMGTQIEANIVMRFSALWTGKPVQQMREYIEALRAIWQAFQQNGRLRYRGETYKFGLLQPFFNPGPIEHPHIPIYIAGVNEGMCRLGGELADGFHVHPFHTVKYLRDLVYPALMQGAEKAGRSVKDVALSCAVFVVTGRDADEIARNTREIKSQIAFYASTPGYRAVLDMHGWGDLGQHMNRLTKEGKWDDMWRDVPDEVLHAMAVVAPPDELPYKLRERYQGLLDRVGYYFPFKPQEADRRIIWEAASRAMHG